MWAEALESAGSALLLWGASRGSGVHLAAGITGLNSGVGAQWGLVATENLHDTPPPPPRSHGLLEPLLQICSLFTQITLETPPSVGRAAVIQARIRPLVPLRPGRLQSCAVQPVIDRFRLCQPAKRNIPPFSVSPGVLCYRWVPVGCSRRILVFWCKNPNQNFRVCRPGEKYPSALCFGRKVRVWRAES